MNYTIEAKEYGNYDVVVCGGGTSGCFAAIAAARAGAKTLLLERSFVVGGMLTVGNAGITKFTEHCADVEMYKKEVTNLLGTANTKELQVVGGLAKEYVNMLITDKKAVGTNGEAGSYVFTDKVEAQYLLIKMLEEANVEVLYDTKVILTKKDGDKVTGVVVVNKGGFFEINAKVIVDATGDGDTAALAGADFNFNATQNDIDEGFGNEVGKGLEPGVMFRVKGVDFPKLFGFLNNNREHYYVQEFGRMSLEECLENHKKGDMLVFRIKMMQYSPYFNPASPTGELLQVYNLPEKDEAILLAPFRTYRDYTDGLDARQISIVQNYTQLTIHSFIPYLQKFPGFEKCYVTYAPDIGIRETRHILCEYMLTVMDVISGRDFDDSIACGGHPIDTGRMPIELENYNYEHWRFHIPYRIMLPLGLDNILVTGRCVGASRGASGAIRPTAQCMAMGEAAGTAAAIAALQSITPKEINIQNLREVLLQNGAII